MKDGLTFTFNDLELSLKGQSDDFDRVTETDGTVLYNRDYLVLRQDLAQNKMRSSAS